MKPIEHEIPKSNRAFRQGKKNRWKEVLPVKEESGTVWLWMEDELLGWDKEITWLFSPPLGTGWQRGDLWGLDEDGELIVVESKKPKDDPFGSLLRLEKIERPKENGLSVDTIRKHWWRRYMEERGLEMDLDLDDDGRHPGILPYGSHRHALKYWPDFYGELKERIANPDYDYEGTVKRLLERRKSRKDCSAPFYFGFITVDFDFENSIPRSALLDEVGECHSTTLSSLESLKAGRVRLAAGCARSKDRKRATILPVEIDWEA